MQTEVNVKEEVEIADRTTVYEVSYLLLSSLAIEQVSSKADEIKKKILSLGGDVFAGEEPVLIDLAYPMTKTVGVTRRKETTGYFGWMKFEMESGVINAVKKFLEESDIVLRFLIIKTVKENTLLNGKMKFQKENTVKKEDELTESPEEDVKVTLPEDLDKSIDDLVIA